MLHRPRQPTRLVSTPLETDGGAPGAMKDSTFASQVPAASLKIACSGPGLGSGGIPCGAAAAPGLSCALARPARPRTTVQATTNVPSVFTPDLLVLILGFSPRAGGEARPPSTKHARIGRRQTSAGHSSDRTVFIRHS